MLAMAGAITVSVLAFASDTAHGPALIGTLEARTQAALDAAGGSSIQAHFTDRHGWLTRHPVLSGGDQMDAAARLRAASAVAAVPGIGGVHWRTGPAHAAAMPESHDCQKDVDAILKSRSIRFADASAAIDASSEELLDEVAAALRPCAGSVIAITGHTDARGAEDANVALSLARADAVRAALIKRGIAASALRARGMGSARPLPDLDASDAANRRIEFSVVTRALLRPTPIDTPGAG